MKTPGSSHGKTDEKPLNNYLSAKGLFIPGSATREVCADGPHRAPCILIASFEFVLWLIKKNAGDGICPYPAMPGPIIYKIRISNG